MFLSRVSCERTLDFLNVSFYFQQFSNRTLEKGISRHGCRYMPVASVTKYPTETFRKSYVRNRHTRKKQLSPRPQFFASHSSKFTKTASEKMILSKQEKIQHLNFLYQENAGCCQQAHNCKSCYYPSDCLRAV